MESLPRDVVLDLCKRLGHDPNRVARITIDPGEVEVIYLHPIVETSIKDAYIHSASIDDNGLGTIEKVE